MKRLLVVVDYQRDFVDGSLGFPGAKDLEPVICRRIREYVEQGDEVVFTLDTHKSDYFETQEGKNLPVEHCIQGTRGWEFYGQVKDLARGHKWFLKNTFGSSEFFRFLTTRKFDQIELVGLVSNICVISNAVLAKTAQPEAVIVVDASATGSGDERLHQAALEVMRGLQIHVI